MENKLNGQSSRILVLVESKGETIFRSNDFTISNIRHLLLILRGLDQTSGKGLCDLTVTCPSDPSKNFTKTVML